MATKQLTTVSIPNETGINFVSGRVINQSRIGRVIGKGLSVLGAIGTLSLGGGALTIATTTSALACGPDSYVGTICAFSFRWCPADWLPANGQLMLIIHYPELYSLIGNQYGENQLDTFSLPDLQGRAAIGFGQGSGLPEYSFAGRPGVPAINLTIRNLPAHDHPATFSGTGGGWQAVSIPANPGSLGVSASLAAKDAQGGATISPGSFLGRGGGGTNAAPIYVDPAFAAPNVVLGGLDVQLTGTPGHGAVDFFVPTGLTGGNVRVGATGSGVPLVTQSPSLAINYCIRANGLFPVRP